MPASFFRPLAVLFVFALGFGSPLHAQVSDSDGPTSIDAIIKQESTETKVLRVQAETGDPAAMDALGLVYAAHPIEEEDEGNEANDLYYKEAARWFQAGADKGNAKAMFSLGSFYEVGFGLKRDPAQAVRWYRMAADRGEANAMYNLAYIYEVGERVEPNPVEALRWYRMAADKGDETAMFALGSKYHDGTGVPRDLGEAAGWMQKAADKGNAAAMLALGQDYAVGEGVPKNAEEAARWYHLAADHGSYEARAVLAAAQPRADGKRSQP